MIYKLTFKDGRIDWCTAQNQLHLLKAYDAENDLLIHDIENLEEISEEAAKTIMIKNTEYDENDPEDLETIPLFNLATGDEFCIVASTELE